MLNQSVMGSDMSYNDIMEDKPLQELYTFPHRELYPLEYRSEPVLVGRGSLHKTPHA